MHHLPEGPGAASLRLGDEPVLLVLPERHPLARKPKLRLAELARDPFIWFPRWRSPRYHDAVTAACGKAGFAMRVVQEVDETTTILGLVAACLPGPLRNENLVEDFCHLRCAAILETINSDRCPAGVGPVESLHPLGRAFQKFGIFGDHSGRRSCVRSAGTEPLPGLHRPHWISKTRSSSRIMVSGDVDLSG